MPDPSRWLELEWIDHYSGHTFRIHANRPPFPDSVKVKTNLDVLTRYRSHPDPKSLGPTGAQLSGLDRRSVQRLLNTTECLTAKAIDPPGTPLAILGAYGEAILAAPHPRCSAYHGPQSPQE